MKNKTFIQLGNEQVDLYKILCTNIRTPTMDELDAFERIENGEYVIISKNLLGDIRRIARQCSNEIAKILIDFKLADGNNKNKHCYYNTFKIKDPDEKGYVFIEWRYEITDKVILYDKYDFRHICVNLSLNQLMSAIKKIASQKSKVKIKNALSELWMGCDFSFLEKTCNEYYKHKTLFDNRLQKADAFVKEHKKSHLFQVFLTINDQKLEYLEGSCGFDVYEKEKEINTLLENNDIQKTSINIVCGNDLYSVSEIDYIEIEEARFFETELQSKYKESNIDNKSVMIIKLKNTSRFIFHLEESCGFDIFAKKSEFERKLIEQEKTNNSNNRGENDVEYAIKWFVASNKEKSIFSIANNCESNYRYNCILLRNPDYINEAQEYDHILVTPAGGVLIETKDWKGTIDVTTEGKWIRHKEKDGAAFGVSSPISQMRRHEQVMRSIIPSVPIFNILCFSNPSAIINGNENIKEYQVINIEQLENTLNEICSADKYNRNDIDDIASTIESYKINKS